jgi:aminoglycoside 9-adenylyltransferase
VSGRWPRAAAEDPVELTVVVRDDVVPWSYSPRREFAYGEWLRADVEGGRISTPVEEPDMAGRQRQS